MFIVLYDQLHSDIVTIAKRSITPNFKTVHKERDVVGLLSILRSICVQNLTRSKVDLYLKQLKILSSTLSYVQKRAYLITILVTPYMTRFLLARVNSAHWYLEKTITSKRCVMIVSPTSNIIFLLTKAQKISMIYWQAISCVPAS